MAASCTSSLFSYLPLSSPSKQDSFSCISFHPTPPSLTFRLSISPKSRRNRSLTLTLASSGSSFSSFDEFDSKPGVISDKKSILADLIHEIEPLDVSLIQKDVPPTTIDAIKRTISGMLGLLPSDRFQVFIEALWEPLSKLLVSSMMTGYTLRNAQYRLYLERNFDETKTSTSNPFKNGDKLEDPYEQNLKILDEISPNTQNYIAHLQSQLSSIKEELNDLKKRSAALQMQQFVGEEKNELLDYLRSLPPDKVLELSEPKHPESKEIIHSVVHGLLATLSPKLHSKAPPHSENAPAAPGSVAGEDCAEKVENSCQFQAHISLSRDYLARLLFWCMLLGHHLRGLECRVELMGALSLNDSTPYEG